MVIVIKCVCMVFYYGILTLEKRYCGKLLRYFCNILTERENSVQFTSSLSQHVLLKGLKVLLIQSSSIKQLQLRVKLQLNPVIRSQPGKIFKCLEWKTISCKQSARWQHLSLLKASALFFLQKKLVVKKRSNLYLGLVMPSGR